MYTYHYTRNDCIFTHDIDGPVTQTVKSSHSIHMIDNMYTQTAFNP